MHQDTEPRIIQLPEEFAERLKQSQVAQDYYGSLSYSGKKAFVNWITTAKKSETRIQRMENRFVYWQTK